MKRVVGIGCALFVSLWSAKVYAASGVTFDLGEGASSSAQTGSALKIVGIMTLLTLAPAILMTTTCFVRIVVVLSFLRTALGTQNTPPQQVLVGLSLFLSMAIMGPTATKLYDAGLRPYLDGEISALVAFEEGSAPLRNFMLKQTREQDLTLFYEIHNKPLPKTPAEVSLIQLVPAFVISELRTAFEMGFMLFVPFLLLDLVVASVTMALGLVMLPPSLISLPLKVMLFVMADGWNLLVGSLVRSFG